MEKRGFAIASLVLGLVSLFTLCMCGIGPICGILAVIFAVVYLAGKPQAKGMAIAGMVCGILGILLALVIVITYVVRLGSVMMDPGYMDEIYNFLEQGTVI